MILIQSALDREIDQTGTNLSEHATVPGHWFRDGNSF